MSDLSCVRVHTQYSSLVADQCAYYVNKPLLQWHRIITLWPGRRDTSFYIAVEAHIGSLLNRQSSLLPLFFRDPLPEFWRSGESGKIFPRRQLELPPSEEYKWPNFARGNSRKWSFSVEIEFITLIRSLGRPSCPPHATVFDWKESFIQWTFAHSRERSSSELRLICHIFGG